MRPAFLTSPGAWLRSRRTLESAVDAACPVHVYRRRVSLGERIAGVVVAVVIGVLMAMALVHWWSA